METINDRLKKIRKHLGFNQIEFAESLGLKQGSYSDVERGKNGIGVSSALQSELENKYRVNIEYLRNGKGNMFLTDKGDIYVQSKNVQINETISIDGHEVSFKSVERAVFDNKEDFLREGGVLQLLIKNEAYELFLKTLKENNISFQ